MITTCPGCGVQLEAENDEMDTRYNASTACTALLAELSGYTLTLGDADFVHQLVVDTYAASHWKEGMKTIRLAFALIGLYLVCERGYTGKEVQQMHMKLAKKSKVYPGFTLPYATATITVKDVLDVPEASRPAMILEWADSVWGIWRDQSDSIEELVEQF